jgi:hypothetical protein
VYCVRARKNQRAKVILFYPKKSTGVNIEENISDVKNLKPSPPWEPERCPVDSQPPKDVLR